jgi:uncharacterized protein (TIGR03437 family)
MNFASFAFLALCSIGAASAQNSILVNTTQISLSSQAGNAQPVSQAITVSSSNAQFAFNVTATVTGPAGINWLILSGSTGTTPAQIIVSANAAALPSGTYTGNVQISSTSAVNSPVNIPVQFVVSGAAVTTLTSSPAAITFNYQLGGTTPAAQTLSVTSNTGAAVPFAATIVLTSGLGWLEVSPASGTTPANLTVTAPAAVVAAGAPGTYTGFVVITPTNGGAALQVPVTLNITGSPTFSASPTSITFNYESGQATPPQQNINLAVVGGTSTFTITPTTNTGGNWLVVFPLSGVTPAILTVGVQQPSFLPPGVYTGNIRVTSGTGQPAAINIPVTLNVSSNPLLSVSPNSLQFSYQPGSPAPAAQTITPTSTSGALNYAVAAQASGGNWLIVNPSSGVTPTPISVSIDPAGLAPGTYTGTVTITGIGTGNPAQTVPVTLTITNNPILTVSASSLVFNYQLGRTPPPAQIVEVKSTGGPFNYTIAGETISGAGYLTISATQGTTPGSFTVGMNPTVLAAGSPGVYQARVILTAQGAANSPLVIPITLNLNDKPLVNVSPTHLSFTYQGGGALPNPQFLALTSTGETCTFTVTSASSGWLTVGPSTGSTPANVTVQINPVGLLPGTYNGSITIAASIPGKGPTLNSPITVPVTLTISAGTLSASPASLTFTQAQGGSAPAAQNIQITSSGNALTYSAVATPTVGNWLTVTPANGQTPGAVTVSVNGAGLTQGNYDGTVTISAVGASNSPLNIPVRLTIGASQTLTVSPASVTFNHQLGASAPVAQTVNVTSSGGSIPFNAAASTSDTGSWLSVTPATGNTNGTISISVNPSGLAAGTYTGTVTVTSSGAGNSPQRIPVTLTVIAIPTPLPTAVVNAASFAPGPIAPGEILTIGGTNLGPATPASFTVNSVGVVDPVLSDTRVSFDNLPGIVLYTSQTQINVITPYGIFGRPTVRMTVSYRNQVSAAIELRVADSAPGIFGTPNSTQGAILNQNFSVNGPNNPAARNSVITIYATGEGPTAPAGQDGRVIPLDINQVKRPTAPVRATIGGVEATVEYAGSAPGFVSGVFQVNVRVSPNTPTGNQQVLIFVGNAPSQANVTAAIN